MYPIRFENLYYDKIWGGRDFSLFRDNLPEGEIGESWDIACHPNGMSVVQNGEFKGMKFDDLINKYRKEILGERITTSTFPLLVKLINAKDKLSVQVHPDDEYGLKHENEFGKTECWYVLEAFEGANLVVGTKNCTKEDFIKAINTGEFGEYLNKISVKKGDFFFVKSGLVHAIGEGVIIAEIQQNSDTTYRVFDYNRGREIHVDKALDVIDFSLKGENKLGLTAKNNGYSKTYLSICDYFAIEKYEIMKSVKENSDKERFFILTFVEGNAKIVYKEGELQVKKGDSILIPATLGEYEIVGEATMLKSYVPDVSKVQNEILNLVIE